MTPSPLRAVLCLFPLLTACDSGTPTPTDAKVVAVDTKAATAVDVKAGADVKANAQVDVAVPAVAIVAPTPTAVVGAAVVVLKPVVEVEAALGKPIVLAKADLELAALVKLVVEGKIHSAAELELLLNAPGAASHRVDLDVDGTLDYIQVVEVRTAGAVALELRAIASSKLDASLAVLVGSIVTTRAEAEGKLLVTASYGAAVQGGADFEFSQGYAAEFRGDVVVLAQADAGAFLAWAVEVGRPSYVSTHVSAADITLAADGGVQFGADAAVRLSAEQLVALRGALTIELAAIAAPEVGGKAHLKHLVKAGGGAKAGSSAKAGVSVKSGASAGAKIGGSVSIGGTAGVSIGGGGKAGGGVKIGK